MVYETSKIKLKKAVEQSKEAVHGYGAPEPVQPLLHTKWTQRLCWRGKLRRAHFRLF